MSNKASSRIIPALLALIFLSACSLQKRRYLPGFYVHKKSAPVEMIVSSSEKKEISRPGEMKNPAEILVASSSASKEILPEKPVSFFPAIGDSCDTIILKNKTQIRSRVLEVGQRMIRYRYCDEPEGAIYNVPKTEVETIVYRNGSKDRFISQPSLPSERTNTVYSNAIRRRANKALWMGILSVPLLFLLGSGVVTAIFAIINGVKALKMIRQEDRRLYYGPQKTAAIVGIAFAAITLFVVALLFVAIILGSLI